MSKPPKEKLHHPVVGVDISFPVFISWFVPIGVEGNPHFTSLGLIEVFIVVTKKSCISGLKIIV